MQEKPLKILLIDHDESFTSTVVEMLGQSRDSVATVVTARSLAAGLAELEESSFDVVILEFFLPDGAGLANISVIKAQSPRVPVIVVGPAANEAFAVEAMHGGAQDYLVKGQVTPHWLLRSIRYSVQRQQADIALMDAEEKYHAIFDHLVEGIFQSTPEGRYLLANAALARIYGYPTPGDLMHDITDIGRKLYVQPGRRDEFVRLMHENDTITDFESPIYRKDGTIIWISENCRAVRNPNGKLLYYEGTVEDITLRREAEQNLRNSESLYHSLVETMPQNVFRKDLKGRFTFANQPYCKHYKCTLEDILGKTDFDFFPKELAEQYQKDDQRVIKTGQTYEIEEVHQPLGQSKTFIQVVKTPLYGANGKIIGLQGIFWDITEQKLAEERIRKANAELARSREELRVKNHQMQDELKMAREIQVAMLPQQYPPLPRNSTPAVGTLQFTHRYLPSGEVGGDFFSISALSDTEAGVFICDVAGHGVRSALVTAMIRALVEELKPLAGDPGQFLTKLNSDLRTILQHAGTPLITTAFYLVADAATGRMRYSNAGHPKPLHIRRAVEKIEPLRNATSQSQPALGIFADAVYHPSEIQLGPDDLVMLFTDGIYEIHGANQELFTQDMLTAAVGKRVRARTGQMFDRLLAEARQFAGQHEFEDDVCLVGVELVPN